MDDDFTDRSAGPEPDWLRFIPTEVRDLVTRHLPDALVSAPVAPGQFLSRSFANAAGVRPYKLFVPTSYTGQPVPLVIMLHGCSQSPDDFAAGTGMNHAAASDGFLVAYPGQPASANPQRCWNWFDVAEQRRGSGEPSLLAGITLEIARDYAVDPARIFIAGLSAGGAAAAIMADAYPDLYAAVGVHSGLACGAAHDLSSALAAMRNGAPGRRPGPHRAVPTIVFHGDRDSTVSPLNAEAVIAQSPADGTTETHSGRTPGGYPFDCTIRRDEAGQIVTEQWTIHGAGHAWSGGNPAGSYTDPRGPDATSEMLRFFREHPHPSPK